VYSHQKSRTVLPKFASVTPFAHAHSEVADDIAMQRLWLPECAWAVLVWTVPPWPSVTQLHPVGRLGTVAESKFWL